MCILPKAPKIPPPPARRENENLPDRPLLGDNDPNNRRRRGYAALMGAGMKGAALQPAMTTTTLGG
jgi:hypothetical protein